MLWVIWLSLGYSCVPLWGPTFPWPIIFLSPPSVLQITVPLQGVLENDFAGIMPGQWQHQACVEWSHSEGAVFCWRHPSSDFHFKLDLHSDALAKPSDMPSAHVAICVQFLLVSVLLLPFNLSFTFFLCLGLPLYFVVSLFSVYSRSDSSLPSFTEKHHTAWLGSSHPTWFSTAAEPDAEKAENVDQEPSPGSRRVLRWLLGTSSILVGRSFLWSDKGQSAFQLS